MQFAQIENCERFDAIREVDEVMTSYRGHTRDILQASVPETRKRNRQKIRSRPV
jgi:hypothetical protein